MTNWGNTDITLCFIKKRCQTELLNWRSLHLCTIHSVFVTWKWIFLMWTSEYNNSYSVYLFQLKGRIKVFCKLQITLFLSLSADLFYKPIVKKGSRQPFFRIHINKKLISHQCPIFPNMDMQFFTVLSKSFHLLHLLIFWEFHVLFLYLSISGFYDFGLLCWCLHI